MSLLKKTCLICGFLGILFLIVGPVLATQAPVVDLSNTSPSLGLNTTLLHINKLPVSDDVPALIGRAIGAALSVIGIIFFVLMLYGGFLWMTAHGNEENTKKALSTIIAATIGVVIIFSSYALVKLVFSSTSQDPCAGKIGPNQTGCDTCGVAGDPVTAGMSCMVKTNCTSTLQYQKGVGYCKSPKNIKNTCCLPKDAVVVAQPPPTVKTCKGNPSENPNNLCLAFFVKSNNNVCPGDYCQPGTPVLCVAKLGVTLDNFCKTLGSNPDDCVSQSILGGMPYRFCAWQ